MMSKERDNRSLVQGSYTPEIWEELFEFSILSNKKQLTQAAWVSRRWVTRFLIRASQRNEVKTAQRTKIGGIND